MKAIPEPRVGDDLRDADVDDELEDDVRLEEVRLTGSWPGRQAEGVELLRSSLHGVQLTGATFEHLLCRDVVFVDCELSGATLSGASLERVRFERCRMSGLVAADLRAKDMVLSDCVLREAWLRMASFERCELSGCDLRGADLYGARIRHSRLIHSTLDETEWAEVSADDVALHGSSLAGVKDIDALRNAVIGSDQIIAVALPILAARGIVVDDEHLDR